MTRHYSTHSFFRQVPNALLARYFTGHGLFDRWLALPEELRKPIDAESQDIFELSCEKGFRAIIDEARWQMQANPEAV